MQSQNSLDFDGNNDYVDCGADTSIQITGKTFTLEAWIYPTAWKTNHYDGNVINKEYNTSNYGYMLRVGAGGKLNFAFGNGSWYELTTAAILSLNTWQHIAGSYDGNKMRVYVNGVAVDSVAVTASMLNNSTPNLMIGASVNNSRYYQGQIDEVKIWNITRSTTEIANGMYNEICSKTNGLKAYYKFNHGKAGKANLFIKTLNDFSGNRNHGSLVNFTLNGSASNWLLAQTFNKSVTDASDTISVCGSFLSPSRKYTWTNSGIFHDTIATVMDCDSAITFYLTIKKPTVSSMKVHACKSYTSPSGAYTWTQSGVYVDHLINNQKCDSAITITLSIGGGRDTLYPNTCMPYTVPSGKKTYSISGHYVDTLDDYRNCDSIIDIYLQRNNTSYANININACRQYTTPSGKYSYQKSGAYQDTIPNVKGCDSFISIQLSILESKRNISITECNAFSSASGRYTWTQSGEYKDTITNWRQCDSVITYQLTIKNNSYYTFSVSTCRSYLSPSGKYLHNSSTTFNDTIPNAMGCDSIITIQLTVININNTVTQNGAVLTSDHNSGSYQWYACLPTMAKITGANNISYTATMNGQYAVEISDMNCKDTSTCYTVSGLDINRITLMPFIVSPNPSQGAFLLSLPHELEGAHVMITDLSGRVILNSYFDTLFQEQFHLIAAQGLYLVTVQSAKYMMTSMLTIE